MSLDMKQRLLPDGRPNKPNRPMKPQYITIHNTDNPAPGATAEAHSRYILNGSGGAKKSWHYTVDDRDIYQHLREDEQGWHAGDGNGPGNLLSLGVEICMYEGMDEPKAWRRAAELIARLAEKHGIAMERIVPHRHWSGKACPSRVLPRWQEFMKLVEEQRGGQGNPEERDYAGHWAESSIQYAIANGMMAGRGSGFAPNESVTRAELAVVIERLCKQMKA